MGDEFAVALDVVTSDIVEEASAPTDKHQQTTTAVVVFLVGLEMFGEVVDAVRKERNLHLGRTGVASGKTKLLSGEVDGLLLGRQVGWLEVCLLYTSPSPRDQRGSRMPSSA